MTEIKPFKAVVYNQEKIKDLSRVVCPPYDVINPTQQDMYMDLSPHNFIHILLPKDNTTINKYKKSGEDFRSYIEDNVLVQDSSPALYFYSQEFNIKGEKKTRFGFIALLRLEDSNSAVYKHEHTRAEPKEDRLKLIREVHANLSPIFAIFPDKNKVIAQMLKITAAQKPFIDIVDTEGIKHKLWRIDDKNLVEKLTSKMNGEDIFIADGHHRYEVACLYREELKKMAGQLKGDESCNYILCYFTNTDMRGLTIMPIHRLVKLKKDFDFDNFILSLSESFVVEPIKDKNKFFLFMQKAGTIEHVLGMYRKNKFWLLRLKNVKILDKIINDKKSEYRSLDVSILNYLVFKKSLGLDIEDKVSISYNNDAEELIKQADTDDSYVAFLLNPVKIEKIMSVALSGEKMPSKSTYFYPKVLSGLVINKHD